MGSTSRVGCCWGCRLVQRGVVLDGARCSRMAGWWHHLRLASRSGGIQVRRQARWAGQCPDLPLPCPTYVRACHGAGYGPLDQGAFNLFYEAEVKGHPISKDFNAKVGVVRAPGYVCVCGGGGGGVDSIWGIRSGWALNHRVCPPCMQPYQEYRPGARIVHLHGPKPNHYLQWLLTGGRWLVLVGG